MQRGASTGGVPACQWNRPDQKTIRTVAKQKRLIRIQNVSHIEQAVLLWLHQQTRAKISQDYGQGFIRRPPSAHAEPERKDWE
jgi:hypothetical protein